MQLATHFCALFLQTKKILSWATLFHFLGGAFDKSGVERRWSVCSLHLYHLMEGDRVTSTTRVPEMAY